MSIIRTSHNRENPYVMLNKSALEDPFLSWAAKGLWAYLMSRSDDWNVSVTHLSSIYSEKGGGERAIYSLLNELIEIGYCERIKVHGGKGQFQKTEYVIKEFKKCLPRCSQADVAQADVLESGTTNKRSLLEKNSPKKPFPKNDISKTTTTTTKEKVVDVVLEEKDKEHCKGLFAYLEHFSQDHGKSWIIPMKLILSLCKQYGIFYLTDQVNCMVDKERKSQADEKNSYKKKKTPRIENPTTYLNLSCEKNWAYSDKLENDGEI